MRYLVSRREPKGDRILLIESGSRALAEGMFPHLEAWGTSYPVDLLTCYGNLPGGFPQKTDVFRVSDYGTRELRRALIEKLRARNYAYVGMICSAEPIMTKWKWLVALRLPAKVFIINENGDYFWLHRENASILRRFTMDRAGLHGNGAIRTLGRLLLFPFSILFLLLYAFTAHLRRAMRRAFQHSS